MDAHEPEIDPGLIESLDRDGTCYTTYPTADRFVDSFDSRSYAKWVARRGAGVCGPLALYLHLPSAASGDCVSLAIGGRDSRNPLRYLSYLHREIALQAPLFRDDARVQQMHWSGAASSFYATDDLAALFQLLRRHFEFAPQGDYSIDVDVRTVDAQVLRELRDIGFNRLKLGVRNIAGDTPRAPSPAREIGQAGELIAEARDAGFESFDIDLMSGRARQTLKSFTSTVEQAVALRPDRIAVFDCAQALADNNMPDPVRGSGLRSSSLRLLASAAERLTASGYVYIGINQFALPNDPLAVAQREGRLQWNCQGYSAHADCDLVGLGLSAIGAIGPTYSENARTLSEYYARLDANDLPIVRGIQLTRDDLVRRSVIQRFLCRFEVSKEAVGINYLLDFDRYFAAELGALRAFEHDGLVEIGADWIGVTPRGRLLVCAICKVFDRYCDADPQKANAVSGWRSSRAR